MPRTASLSALVLGLLVVGVLVLAGCSPSAQSQPPAAVTTPSGSGQGSTAAPAAGSGATAKPAAPAPAAKPTAVPSRAAGQASPAASPAGAATGKPVAAASPAASAGNRAATTPPAVVATSVAGLPAVGASPAVSAEARGAARPDALGVAASAGGVAAANASDTEATALCGPGAILSTRAGQVAGRQATIAINRVEASYQPNLRGQPTFLNDAPYPNHVFTAVVWGDDRKQFQPPLESWQGKAACVTGPVELFQQRPQIVVSSPSQLRAAH